MKTLEDQINPIFSTTFTKSTVAVINEPLLNRVFQIVSDLSFLIPFVINNLASTVPRYLESFMMNSIQAFSVRRS